MSGVPAMTSSETWASKNISALLAQTLPSRSISNVFTGETPSPSPDVSNGAFLPWDNPNNVISLETYTTISIVSNCILYPVLFLVGVPTNVLSCMVFWRQGLSDRMNLCLFCLAVVDMLYLIVLIIQAASTVVSFVDEVVGAEYYAKSLIYCLGVGWGFKAASGCISMVIAMERCFCVVRPLHIDALMRTCTMGWILAAIVMGTQLAQLIQPFAYTTETVQDTKSGQIHWKIVASELYLDNKVVFDFILVALLPFIIPLASFIVVSVTTAVTVIKLKIAAKWREELFGSHQHVALTPVLVFLSCIYITCTAPLVSVTLVRLLIPDFSPGGRYSNICISAHIIGTVCSAVNSAVNFFVYLWMSSRYRQVLRAVCGIKQKKRSCSIPTMNSTSAEVNSGPQPLKVAMA